MQKVRANGQYQILAKKTGAVLIDNLPVDLEFEIEDPLFESARENSIVQKVLAESRLRMLLVAEFHAKLRDRKTYLKIGGTQWCIELVKIEYDFALANC
jgi:hypothetical protein